jgi:hypothetical protein
VRPRHVILCVLAAAAVAGCGGDPAAPGGPLGTVHGMIVVSGGPPGATPHGAAGTVLVTRGGAVAGRQDVAEGGQFRFSLDPGPYRLSVRGVGGACVARDVTVAAASEQTVDLVCRWK